MGDSGKSICEQSSGAPAANRQKHEKGELNEAVEKILAEWLIDKMAATAKNVANMAVTTEDSIRQTNAWKNRNKE